MPRTGFVLGATVLGVPRPVVGIPTPIEHASWRRVWEAECAMVAMSYVDAVQRAGGLALLDPLDALLLAGGADVGPATYGADPHPETKGVRAERDAFELALLAGAIGR